MVEKETIVFGGGCFWCTEAVFEQLRGVLSVTSGYAGGEEKNPTYYDVAFGKTNHAEVIKVDYDPSMVNFCDLLTVFFATHDPTTLNRQGNDVGPQYRSVILYTNENQKEEAERFIKELDEPGERPVVTEVKLLDKFYEAEEEHKQFYLNNKSQPYCQIVINPKLEKLRTRYRELLKR